MTDAGFLPSRGGRLTGRRLAAVLAAAVATALAVLAVAPLVGVEPGADGRALTLLDPGAASEPGTLAHTIFVYQRLPRALAAMVVGMALGAAGATFQALLRNPLAEPFTLGISSGSSLAAVLAIRLGLDGALDGGGTAVAAVLGAGGAVGLVALLGRVGRALPPATLLLAGVTVAMWCSAASLLVQYTAEFSDVPRMLRWMMGGLEAVRWSTLARSAAAIAAGLAVLLALARSLNALAAGAEAAASVGVAVGPTQAAAFAAASLLVGAAIAVAGPVGFVGLMVPHALRPVTGPDLRALLPASALAGGALLVVCDTVARLALWPSQLPVGLVTALLGAPFLLALLVRARRHAGPWEPS